ncbi:hypothetical protein BFP71_10725 [Roseivirga misakiensis]|uniref:DUF4249 domain-containing protein n=1 Tax=Roseivirga misakiensis TaxID=1563681 RepID=A0A1E5SXX6_9BACT|nr:hypothetical protein BFP71_10725 [Roseivirga misakiensis]
MLFTFSCTDTLDVDLEEGTVRLVVEGRLELFKDGSGSGYQSIRLTTTAPYFQNEQVPAATGASVLVRDLGTQQIYQFTESNTEPGIYETQGLVPIVGNEYQLEIEYEGNTYQATDRMLPVADIDRLAQFFKEETIFTDEGIGLELDYEDPTDEVNYYHWQTFRNDTLLVKADVGNQFNLVSSDEFYNGLQVQGFELANDFTFQVGDVALVRQYALSEAAYDYYRNFYEQAVGISPGFGDVVPATLRGNVRNLTDDSLYPLGFFEASEVAQMGITIQ